MTWPPCSSLRHPETSSDRADRTIETDTTRCQCSLCRFKILSSYNTFLSKFLPTVRPARLFKWLCGHRFCNGLIDNRKLRTPLSSFLQAKQAKLEVNGEPLWFHHFTQKTLTSSVFQVFAHRRRSSGAWRRQSSLSMASHSGSSTRTCPLPASATARTAPPSAPSRYAYRPPTFLDVLPTMPSESVQR